MFLQSIISLKWYVKYDGMGENVLLRRSNLKLETLETFLTMIHYFFVWFGELRE